MLKSYQQTDR